MLSQLRIQNFALIDGWALNFEGGETAVTGETGSGKSLFVGAMAYLSGGNPSPSLKPSSGKDLTVEGVFCFDPVPDKIQSFFQKENIDLEEGEIILRRSLSSRGNQQRINDVPVTRKTYLILAEQLMDIHSQNAQTALRSNKFYLPLIDLYAGQKAEKLKEDLSLLLEKKLFLSRDLEALNLSPEEVEREKDLLQYQIREIDQAGLELLDEEALNQEYRSLVSAKERRELASSIYQAISSDQYSIRNAMESLARALDQLTNKDPQAGEAKDLAWQMEAEAEALRDFMDNYLEKITINPGRIFEIDQIFQTLQGLRRKYGQSFKEIQTFQKEARQRLNLLSEMEKNRADLQEKMKVLQNDLEEKAEALSHLRKKAASQLENQIRLQMKEMAVKKIAFEVSFANKETIGPDGKDRVDFMISTNPGQSMQSMSQVASGGEMSRFMLAFKIAVSEVQPIFTMVFDEIDTGISGRTAQVLAEKMKKLGENHQLIVITHLPQIAAAADHHLLIQKEVQDGRTCSKAKMLNEDQRAEELARLIGGAKVTEITRSSAREMLGQAKDLSDELRKKEKD